MKIYFWIDIIFFGLNGEHCPFIDLGCWQMSEMFSLNVDVFECQRNLQSSKENVNQIVDLSDFQETE